MKRIALALAAAGLVILSTSGCNVQTHDSCTVISKESIAQSEGGHTYRIGTEECGVFENTDSTLDWKFNSADLQNDIKEGETYNFTTRWWRAPILSMFPNIVEYELVEKSE